MNIGDIKHEIIENGSFGYTDVESKCIGFDGQNRAIFEFVKETRHTWDEKKEEPVVEKEVVKAEPKPQPKQNAGKKPAPKRK